MDSSSFTPDNAAIVLIDHQDLTVSWIYSQPQATTVNNVRMLARIGAELGVPHMVTSTMEDVIGTNIKDIQELAPDAYAARVRRGGTLNGFLDPAFAIASFLAHPRPPSVRRAPPHRQHRLGGRPGEGVSAPGASR